MKKNFTLDSFKQELQEFYNKPTGNREFVVMTGSGGKSLLDQMMIRVAAETLLDDLKERTLVNEEEYGNLNKMIHSPDSENLIVAMAVIEQKNEQRRISTSNLLPINQDEK